MNILYDPKVTEFSLFLLQKKLWSLFYKLSEIGKYWKLLMLLSSFNWYWLNAIFRKGNWLPGYRFIQFYCFPKISLFPRKVSFCSFVDITLTLRCIRYAWDIREVLGCSATFEVIFHQDYASLFLLLVLLVFHYAIGLRLLGNTCFGNNKKNIGFNHSTVY